MDLERAERAVADFLAALDVDIEAAGMAKTPARVAKMYAFLFDGLHKETALVWGETFAAGAGGLVAVGLPPGQHGIAQVDDGAQFAGGGDFGNQGGVIDGIGGHGGSPVCTAMRFRELSRRAAPGQGWFPRR